MSNDAPTLAEITQLTRQELTTASTTDSIRECGRAALALLPTEPSVCKELAYQKLHDVPYREVKECWRRLYVDATLWNVVEVVEKREEHGSGGGWIDEVVRLLDMALILTGAPAREKLVELWFAALKAVLPTHSSLNTEDLGSSERPYKRRKLSPTMPSRFPSTLPTPTPMLRHPLPRTRDLSLEAFQARVANTSTHAPIIIEGAIQHWSALDERPWSSPNYLLEQTLGGRRLVPIEVGKSYTDEAWGQKIITFKAFMETYMFHTTDSPQTGYLAQHDLFAQVPALRADISIPDYCYSDPAPSPHLTHIKPTAKLEEPLLNAWFGPGGTVSPLHNDPYHNILAQVVGYKYVRLYAPDETAKLYPRSVDENGVDMSNTSQVDLIDAMRVWSEISCCPLASGEERDDDVSLREARDEFEMRFPEFRHARYLEAVLCPGELLYLPVGWWHYIRSLTPSFSVSFWFN